METASLSTWVWSRHVFRLQKVVCPTGRKHWSKSEALQLQRDLIVAYSESGAQEARDIKFIDDSRVPLWRQLDKLAWQHWASGKNSVFPDWEARQLLRLAQAEVSGRPWGFVASTPNDRPLVAMASLDSNECLNTDHDCRNRRYRDTELLER